MPSPVLGPVSGPDLAPDLAPNTGPGAKRLSEPRSKLYFRPTGLLYGDAADLAVTEQRAQWLAGGRAAFSLMEIIDREDGDLTSLFCPYYELKKSTDSIVLSALEKLTAKRPDVAGLSMDDPHIMGIVNITPDSFFDGGLYDSVDAGIRHAAALASNGASIVDIGGESTRPGADKVDVEAEIARVVPVIEGLRGIKSVISLDTRKADVMQRGLNAGAQMLNDVSALSFDESSLKIAANSDVPVVLMHSQGGPQSMQIAPSYEFVLYDVFDFLQDRIAACLKAGIAPERLIVDPGIGFGKTKAHNMALLSGLTLFHGLGVPVLVGASRKSFIGALVNESDPKKRMPGSIAAALSAFSQGVQILRCHDVADTKQALKTWTACQTGRAQ